jgi:hypothetical protein
MGSRGQRRRPQSALFAGSQGVNSERRMTKLGSPSECNLRVFLLHLLLTWFRQCTRRSVTIILQPHSIIQTYSNEAVERKDDPEAKGKLSIGGLYSILMTCLVGQDVL